MKALKVIGISLAGLVGLLVLTINLITYHPDPLEDMDVQCDADAPELQPGQELKIMNWNVQYMAGKSYVFWYDVTDGSGKDYEPEYAEVEKTLEEFLRIVKDEKPDVLLLQEVNVDAKSTGYMDQVARIMEGLGPEYPCQTSAYYWKSDFVPDPNVLGSVGMKLLTISRYRIESARRHQLSIMPMDIVSQQFYLKRAILEASLPVEDRKPLVLLNTHLDAFAQGTDTMQKQVAEVRDLLLALNEEGNDWLIAGDFNLLPPGWDRSQLHENDRVYYQEESEIESLFSEFNSSVDAETLNGPNQSRYYTHFPNSHVIKEPDRTIDYMFFSADLEQLDYRVRRDGTLTISDHLPMIGVFRLPR
ncbi:MAG TPA: metal-dependent hydrolase [Leptospiraceae bacterium]|nr:metal-dependent hydrolase [Spirochaetaceae bacterium]HBS04305.1 metal-dependent hydrolase [Leptospiraceae bacterium]|tara:strand:- start:185804 stop:186883 length:1080 start_codon:yes stop_codon:yes gene_type:complete